MFAGEGTPGAHQPPLPLPLAGPARGAAVDRLRLGHAVRRGPRRAPRHLRQGRQLRRLDRHPRRRQEALLGLRPVRADDLGLDDDQRPGADHPRLLHERRDRPAGRDAPAGDRRLGRRPSAGSTRSSRDRGRARLRGRAARRATTASGSGCSASPGDMVVEPRRYERIKAETLRTVRGTVQADILKEDQAQNTCIFSTEFALKMMGDVQEYFVANGGAELLLASRSAGTTSPRPGRTRSRSSRSRSPTASRSSSTTSRAAWRSTPSRRT